MLWRKVVLSQVILGCLAVPLPVGGSSTNLTQQNSKRSVKAPGTHTRTSYPKKPEGRGIKLFCIERQRMGDNDAIESVIADLRANGHTVLQYSTKGEMVTLVSQFLGKGICLEELSLFGHGSWGILNMGNGQHDDYEKSTFIAYRGSRHDRDNDWRRVFLKLKKRFCPGGMLQIIGCNVGAGRQGVSLLMELAEYFEVRVQAPVDDYSVGYSGEWQWADYNMKSAPLPKYPKPRKPQPRTERRLLFP